MPGYRLKYLFKAFYANGDVLAQGPEDLSVLHPGLSAYADVDHDQLVAFGLECPWTDTRVGVDMLTGEFKVNGVTVLDPENLAARAVTPKRLIYYRQVSQHMTQMVGAPEREAEAEVVYFIGWQANDREGHNVQRVLEVD